MLIAVRKALYLYSSWSLHILGLSLFFFFLDCHIFKKKFSNTLLGRELGSPMSHLTPKFTLFLGRSVAFQNELFWVFFVCFVVLGFFGVGGNPKVLQIFHRPRPRPISHLGKKNMIIPGLRPKSRAVVGRDLTNTSPKASLNK